MQPPQIGSDGFYHPRDEDQIRELIALANREGTVIRARGAAHSVHAAIFSDSPSGRSPDPGGIDIMLDQLRRIEFDESNMLVTVQAGCNLGRDPTDPTHTSTIENSLFQNMSERGWAFPDTGGIIHQTVAGFLAYVVR